MVSPEITHTHTNTHLHATPYTQQVVFIYVCICMYVGVAIIITKRPPIKVEVGVAKEGMEEGDMGGDRVRTQKGVTDVIILF